MDMKYSKTDLEFRDEVRTFLDDKLEEKFIKSLDQTPGVFVEPDELGKEWHTIMYQQGWITPNWPVEHGGTAWTPMQNYIFEKELAQRSVPRPSPISIRLIGPVLCEYGTEPQKAKFLPRIRSGEDLWAQGYSEPGSGSDLASLSMRAEKKGDKYILNGTKIWTTHGHHANWIFCLVRTSQEKQKQNGISFMLVPMEQAGITVTPIIPMSGQGWDIAKFLLQNERGGSCFAPKLQAKIKKMESEAEAIQGDDGTPMINDRDFSRRLAKLKLRAIALDYIELGIQANLAKGRPPGPATSLTKLTAASLTQDIQKLNSELFGYNGLQLPYERPLYGDDAPEPVGCHSSQISLAALLNGRASRRVDKFWN